MGDIIQITPDELRSESQKIAGQSAMLNSEVEAIYRTLNTAFTAHYSGQGGVEALNAFNSYRKTFTDAIHKLEEYSNFLMRYANEMQGQDEDAAKGFHSQSF